MRVAGIKYFDVANGSGVRTSLFISGCKRYCKGCFNPEAWDFSFGEEFTECTEKEILDSLRPDYIAGLSVLGGEPLESCRELVPFLRRVKEMYPKKELWLFTGYELEKVVELGKADASVAELLGVIDVIKVGPFVEELKEAGLAFRGSSNQKIYRVESEDRGARPQGEGIRFTEIFPKK